MTSITERVTAASAGRDRVLDAVKAFALVVVVIGHSLAWHVTPSGTAVNVLEVAPGLILLTWVFQVLPLFFAAGAVSNAGSLSRSSPPAYLRHRSRRLLTPVLVYCAVWTVVLLPLTAISEQAQPAADSSPNCSGSPGLPVGGGGRTATTRWRSRPRLTLGLAVIVAVDVTCTLVRSSDRLAEPAARVGWLHQLGYELPAYGPIAGDGLG
jgi:hypothetical protein